MEKKIEDFIKPGAKVHLVGVCGVSMAPLAEVLKGRGAAVTGSDMKESQTADRLRGAGLSILETHQRKGWYAYLCR